MQVGGESLRGHEEASGLARHGGSAEENQPLPRAPQPPLTCTKVVFPEPAIPSTSTHTGGVRGVVVVVVVAAAASPLSAAAAAIFPAATCPSGARGGRRRGGPTAPRHDARGTWLSPCRRRPGTHLRLRAASPRWTARSGPRGSWQHAPAWAGIACCHKEAAGSGRAGSRGRARAGGARANVAAAPCGAAVR